MEAPVKILIYVRPGVGESSDEQLAAVEAVRARLRAEGYEDGAVYQDGPGAAGVAFGCRGAAARLLRDVERSDAVLLARTARSFRNLKDLVQQLELLAALGVRFILADLNIDSGVEGAGALARLLGNLVDAGREMRGEPVMNAIRSRRAHGRPYRQAPYGYRLSGRKGARCLVPDPQQRAIGKLILGWKNQGFTWEEIYHALLRRGARRREGRELSLGSIKRWCQCEARLQALEASRAREQQEQYEVEDGKPSAGRV
jgi:DNA invertase Pin-like site-specific DNA recombinase